VLLKISDIFLFIVFSFFSARRCCTVVYDNCVSSGRYSRDLLQAAALRDRTSAFLGRRKLSVFGGGVVRLSIDYSLNPLSSLP
jgi:hypothetical protein